MPAAAIHWEAPPFGLSKMFTGGSKSRQMGVLFRMIDYSVDLRESAPPAIQKTNCPLCTQEFEEWMPEHLTEVSPKPKTKYCDYYRIIMRFQRSIAKYRAKSPKTPIRSLRFSGYKMWNMATTNGH
jgi:hypothetical protein